MAITLVDSSVVGGAERHRSSLPVWMRMRIVSVEACPLIHDAARGKMSSHRTSSVTSEDGETPVPESLYAIKRSYYCIGLLSACIVPLCEYRMSKKHTSTYTPSYSPPGFQSAYWRWEAIVGDLRLHVGLRARAHKYM